MTKELIEYLRDETKRPVGVMIGVLNDQNEICVGVSRCHQGNYNTHQQFVELFPADTWDSKKGLIIARGRAYKGDQQIPLIYNVKQRKQYENFLDRCVRYFRKG